MEGKMMLARVKSTFGIAAFAARNLSLAHRLNGIEKKEIDGLIFRGYLEADSDSISKLYRQLNDGAVFSKVQRWLYKRIGSGCLFVVEQRGALGASKIVGMNMYYLNRRDFRENTIHEGFVGVLPEAGGRGVATTMRQMAIEHFKSAGFSGMSTRISLNNMASLASAKKIGFQTIEKYQEPSTGEQRNYMVCKF
jgi:L-amino acid N-acyltransferase YncA